jgi:hypothetical protein
VLILKEIEKMFGKIAVFVISLILVDSVIIEGRGEQKNRENRENRKKNNRKNQTVKKNRLNRLEF